MAFLLKMRNCPRCSVDGLAERVAYLSIPGLQHSYSLEVVTQKKQCFLWPEVDLKVLENLNSETILLKVTFKENRA